MELLTKHQKLRQEIFDYFGYVEDWRILPINDTREYYWVLDGDGPGCVRFAETEEQLLSDGDYYENIIYTQRHLPRWVYRGEDYTMIVADTETDGNKLLQIFTNANERQVKGE